MSFRNLGVVSLVLACILVLPTGAFAQTNQSQRVVVVNQVRGTECCDSGSLANFKRQQSALSKLDLTGVFAFRYDALTNPQFAASFQKDQFEAAAFLELTPSLAADAGVTYTGTSETWYQAHHAYTLGYPIEDRRALVDQYMQRFKQQFGTYPKLVVAWMLDAPTATYLAEQYKVAAVEITREQWGTDSYTLSGGPPHYPYRASKNWLMVPAGSAEESSIVVLRQTNADPLYNYGDAASAFTTQPNDYVRDGKNFDYFAQLASTMLSQSSEPYSFLLLGLENSMPETAQAEFEQQLAWVASKQSSSFKVVNISNYLDEAQTQGWLDARTSSLNGVDDQKPAGLRQAIWITTPAYRVRLVRNGSAMMISDIRVYSSEVADPYQSYVGQNHGYWVVPFLLDGSRFYSSVVAPTGVKATAVAWLKQRLLPENRQDNKEPQPPKNEFDSYPAALFLPEIQTNVQLLSLIRKNADEVSITYTSKGQQTTELTFSAEQIGIQTNGAQKLLSPQLHSLVYQLPMLRTTTNTLKWSDESISVTLDCQTADQCQLSPSVSNPQALSQQRATQYTYVFPEVADRPIDPARSVVYAHSKFSIAGRNPARLVLLPKDDHGFRTQLTVEPTVTANPPIAGVSIKQQDGITGTTFIDVLESKPGAYRIDVALNGQAFNQQTVYLAPDCRQQPAYCVRHPIQATWFVAATFFDRLRTW